MEPEAKDQSQTPGQAVPVQPQAQAAAQTPAPVQAAAKAEAVAQPEVAAPAKPGFPEVRPGYTVKVGLKIIEGERERVQTFEGTVMRVRRTSTGTNITLRKVSQGIGVERTFPLDSPRLEKVEVVRFGKVRRAKLYYLRNLSAKEVRQKVKARRRDEVR